MLTARDLVCGKAIELTGASSNFKTFLAATTTWVRRTPRSISTTVTIMMTNLRTSLVATCPVVTGMVLIIREICSSIIHAAGQDVVLIGFIATSLNAVARFVESSFQCYGSVIQV